MGTLRLMVVMIVFCLMLGLALFGFERVSIRVDPAFVRPGGNFSIYCKVPKHEDNRKIRLEAAFVGAKEELLEGLNSPQIYSVSLRLSSCLPTLEASCLVTDRLGKTFLAKQEVEVLGCE